jgi:hypothetical protein
MLKRYNGVLNKRDGEFILISNDEDINLSKEFKIFYMKDVDLHIKITNSKRTLVNEYGAFYLDRDSKKQYRYHLNDLNIESILDNTLNDLLEVIIGTEELEVDTDEAGITA